MKHHFIDNYSDRDSFLHRISAKKKMISLAIFLLTVIFTPPEAFILFAIYFAILTVAFILSRLPAVHVMKRLIVVAPFVLVVAFTAKPIIVWNVCAKATLCTTAMLLLISSTRFPEILAGLASFKVPALFIMVLSFMYRYSFIIVDEYERMARARKARTFGGSRWFHFKAICNMVASLFLRTFERSESVYLAMCARGFDGKIKFSYRAKSRD